VLYLVIACAASAQLVLLRPSLFIHPAAPQATAAVPAASVALAAPPAPTPPPAVPDAAPLQRLIDTFTAGQPAQWGIYVQDLRTGATAHSNSDTQFLSASLYKLFVAYGIYQQIDAGRLPAARVAACLNQMITVSSNDCGQALGNRLGWGEFNAQLKAAGFNHTNLASLQKTSAADVALLLERLYQGKLLSPASTQAFLGLLKAQQINNRLPIGLPAGTPMAHKTGDLFGYVHDAGIVYGPTSAYLVAVLSGPWSAPGSAPSRFAELSRQLYEAFE
jgi:beta-lactamase class A